MRSQQSPADIPVQPKLPVCNGDSFNLPLGSQNPRSGKTFPGPIHNDSNIILQQHGHNLKFGAKSFPNPRPEQRWDEQPSVVVCTKQIDYSNHLKNDSTSCQKEPEIYSESNEERTVECLDMTILIDGKLEDPLIKDKKVSLLGGVICGQKISMGSVSERSSC
ncbi:hypothetical protein PPACK8108_LOCUS5789, partial [Phakopsora pachyrhizi]